MSWRTANGGQAGELQPWMTENDRAWSQTELNGATFFPRYYTVFFPLSRLLMLTPRRHHDIYRSSRDDRPLASRHLFRGDKVTQEVRALVG